MRIGLGIYLTLLGLTVMPWNEQALLAFFIFFTVGFIVTNLVGLRGGRERRCLVEFGAMLFGLGQITCLVMATGGAKGPLLFLFFIPIFMDGFRLGPQAAYLSATVNSMVLALLSLVPLRGGFSISAFLGLMAVFIFMWVEAFIVGILVRHIVMERDELIRLARHDPLTGLPNRRSLYELFGRLIAEKRGFGVILLDLDGFKATNDKYGHLFGDEVLKRVAGAMQRAVGREDAVARFGGDEFAVVVPGGREEGAEVVERLKEVVERVSREMMGTATGLSLSAGLAVWPADGSSFEEILQAADRRLYQAKENKKSNFC
ncbi:MAG: GGDEF domain-containing protein [Bacillota bacterium]